MKPTSPIPPRRTATLVSVLALTLASHAAPQTWQNAGSPDIWDTVTGANWSPGPFANGDTANFGGTGETVDVSGAVTAGGITFAAGGYTIADADNDGTLTLAPGAIITLPATGLTNTLSESLAAGSFTITRPTSTGTATLNLSAANAIAGTISVTHAGAVGTMNLICQADNVTNENTILNLSGNTSTTVQFWLNGFTTTLGGLTNGGSSTRKFSNGTNPTDSGTLILNVATGLTYTYSAQMGNTSAGSNNATRFQVFKTGDGLQEFTSASALSGTTSAGVGYYGDTTITQGALGFAPISGNLGPTSSLVRLDGGVIQNTAAATCSRNLGSTPGTFATVNSNFLMTANGGGFSAKGGILTVNIGGVGGTLDWGTTAGTELVGPLKFGHATSDSEVSFVNPVKLNGAVRTVEVADNTASTADFATLNGALTNGSGEGGITKTGPGLLLLNAVNTYTGSTTVSGGTLSAVAPSALPGYNVAGKITVGSAGTLQLRVGGAGEFAASDLSAITTNASFDAGSSLGIEVLTGNTVTLSTPVSQTNIGLRKDGAGFLNLLTSNSYTGGTVIAAGVVRISDNASLGGGTVTLAGGALSSDGGTAKSLANALSLAGASTLGDASNTGTLTFTSPVTFGGGARTVTISSDVVFAGGASNGRVNIKLGSGTLTYQGTVSANGLIEIQNGSVVIEGDYTGTDAIRILNNVGTTSTLTLTTGASLLINNTASNLRVGATGGNTSASNIAEISGTLTLLTGGSGGLVRFGQGNTNGTINLNPGGMISTKNVAEETSTGVSTFNFDGGTLRALQADAAFLSTNLDAVTIGLGGAIIDSNGFDLTVPKGLAHLASLGVALDGGLTKTGAGILTLSGTNTYTGPTTVNGGTLVPSSAASLGGSTVIISGGSLNLNSLALAKTATIANGGTLTGSGTIGATTLNGALTPAGAALAGAVTVDGDLSIGATGGVSIEIGGTTAGAFDTVTSTGAVQANGSINVSLINGFAPALNNSFTVLLSGDGITGTPTYGLPALTSGLAWQTSTAGGNLTLTVVNAPPSDPVVAYAESFGLSDGNAAFDADPDGDGLTNIFEYAFGSNPNAGNSAQERPAATTSATGQLVLTYRRPTGGASGVTYAIEINTAGLAGENTNWGSAVLNTDYTESIQVNGGFETVTVTFANTVSGKKFGRVFVSY